MPQYNPITGITSYAPTAEELGAEPMAAASVDTAPAAPAEPIGSSGGMFSAPAPEWYWDESANGWRSIADSEQMLAPDAVFNGIRKFQPEIRDEDGRVDYSNRPFAGGNPAYLQMVWDSTPGNGAAKLNAVAQTGIGTPSAIMWLQQAGIPLSQADIDAIMGSGEMIATQQHFQSKASQGPFGGMFQPILELGSMLDVSGITNMLTSRGTEDLGFADYLANPAALFDRDTAEISRGLARMSTPAAPVLSHTGQAIRYGDPFDPKGMVQNSAISAGTGAAISAIAPYVSDLFDEVFGGGPDFALDPADAEEISRATLESAENLDDVGGAGFEAEGGMLPVSSAAPAPTFDPAEYDWQADMSPDTTFATRMMEAAELAALDGQTLEEADAQNLQALEAGDTPPAEPTIAPETVKRYAKVAQTLYKMLDSEAPGMPDDAPQRAEDVTDEQYAEQLVEYANLDAEAMAAQGFVPGTPQYYDHIMGQMDSVINQVLEGMDVDSADLANQLRTKTDEELRALERALFIRGQMEQLMGSGTYTDPATGLDEEVIGDGMFNPGRGAYQRGLARNVNDLGRLRGADARKFLGDLTSRDVDFFGMQGRADERALDEQYLLEDDLKRRRGMFGMG